MSALDIIGKTAVGIVAIVVILLLVGLLVGLGAVAGGLVGYGVAVVYNSLFALALDPMLAAALGSIVAILAGGSGAATQSTEE
jgi:hypothetical protein